MRKNGFTMIELLISVAILLIITIIALPSIFNLEDKTTEKAYNSKIQMILSSAKEWGNDNLNSLNDECTNIFVRELIEEGYLDGDSQNKTVLKNPKNNESMNNFVICVTFEYNGLGYTVESKLQEE